MSKVAPLRDTVLDRGANVVDLIVDIQMIDLLVVDGKSVVAETFGVSALMVGVCSICVDTFGPSSLLVMWKNIGSKEYVLER